MDKNTALMIEKSFEELDDASVIMSTEARAEAYNAFAAVVQRCNFHDEEDEYGYLQTVHALIGAKLIMKDYEQKLENEGEDNV